MRFLIAAGLAQSVEKRPLRVSLNLVRMLLKHNADLNIQDNSGYTALHLAVNARDENLVRLCFEHHADVNIQNNSGYTALHLAVNARDVIKYCTSGPGCPNVV